MYLQKVIEDARLAAVFETTISLRKNTGKRSKSKMGIAPSVIDRWVVLVLITITKPNR
jgi:hypothetical protein